MKEKRKRKKKVEIAKKKKSQELVWELFSGAQGCKVSCIKDAFYICTYILHVHMYKR